ncbi:hypothetical protein OG372_23140 [Streptomyces sp. NBC_01020]|uniref:hypothetical protein n=1 Tax=unclassified Streptomyces TaxID=2593676 RepID=UPI00224F1EE6|nr:hypothetical protein [Streptomyces sp. NBC_01306]MCX4724256.1 hypothetical protein [Streptomyces sp. NBC_01306]WSV06217.1 hypothetical protein OG372_23140 [Streptomyces sp. NBC_01020]
MNAPVHFKQQLADELNVRATALSAPAGHRTPLRFRAPRRGLALTVGLAAAAAAVAVAVPMVSGSNGAQQAAPASRSTENTPSTHSVPNTGLNIVNADYAVRSKPGGMVSVQLFNVKGIPGLQAALDKAGIPAKVLAPSASCHTTGHPGSTPHGSLLKVMPQSGFHSNGVHDIKPSAIQPGDHLLFIAATESNPPGVLATRLVHQVPSCIPAN